MSVCATKLAAMLALAATDVWSKTRVKDFSLFSLPRIGVDVPIFLERNSENAVDVRQIASAKSLDSESGLYYLRARYYDPTTAQLISRDPAVAMTMSPYGYTGGNPVNRTDPSGLYAVCSPYGGVMDNGLPGPSGANLQCPAANYFICGLNQKMQIGSCFSSVINVEPPHAIVFPLQNGSPQLQFTTQGTGIAQAQLTDISCDYAPRTLILPPAQAAAIREAWQNYLQQNYSNAKEAAARAAALQEIFDLLGIVGA